MIMVSRKTKGKEEITLELHVDRFVKNESLLTIAAPLAFRGGDANLYRYVQNNSTNRIDPTGLLGLPKTQPVKPADWPPQDPRNTFVLGGPPSKAGKYPDNHNPPTAPMSYFCSTRGVPNSQYFPFESLAEFERQVDRIRNIIAANNQKNVHIIISGHAAPGIFEFGHSNNGRRNVVSTRPEDRSDLKRFLDALRSIYLDTSPSRTGSVFLEGCNSYGFDPSNPENGFGGSGPDLFAAIMAALGGGIDLYGEIGFSSVAGDSLEFSAPGTGVIRYQP